MPHVHCLHIPLWLNFNKTWSKVNEKQVSIIGRRHESLKKNLSKFQLNLLPQEFNWEVSLPMQCLTQRSQTHAHHNTCCEQTCETFRKTSDKMNSLAKVKMFGQEATQSRIKFDYASWLEFLLREFSKELCVCAWKISHA